MIVSTIINCLIIFVLCFNCFSMYRNKWVFDRRTELNRFEGDVHVITQYADYMTMFLKFWIWDVEKFRLSERHSRDGLTLDQKPN